MHKSCFVISNFFFNVSNHCICKDKQTRMVTRPSRATDISQREMHTWSCESLRRAAMESQESSWGHAPGALCCKRAPLQNENRAATWSLPGVLHGDTGKVKGTPYPAQGRARGGMSNVTKPLSLLATATAQEANTVSCWLLQDSSLLPVSSLLQRNANTVNQGWVYPVLLSH